MGQQQSLPNAQEPPTVNDRASGNNSEHVPASSELPNARSRSSSLLSKPQVPRSAVRPVSPPPYNPRKRPLGELDNSMVPDFDSLNSPRRKRTFYQTVKEDHTPRDDLPNARRELYYASCSGCRTPPINQRREPSSLHRRDVENDPPGRWTSPAERTFAKSLQSPRSYSLPIFQREDTVRSGPVEEVSEPRLLGRNDVWAGSKDGSRPATSKLQATAGEQITHTAPSVRATQTLSHDSNGIKATPTGPKGRQIRLPRVDPAVHAMPHIFIPNDSVPAAPSTSRHLYGFLRRFQPEYVEVDDAGFYVVFPNNVAGRSQLDACFRLKNGEIFFGKYTIAMVPYREGIPTLEGTKFDGLSQREGEALEKKVAPDDSSSISGGATTSSRSSSHRSKCHVCQQASIGVTDSLIGCATCPRQYHRRCQLSPPREDVGDDTWQCQRCVKKRIVITPVRVPLSTACPEERTTMWQELENTELARESQPTAKALEVSKDACASSPDLGMQDRPVEENVARSAGQELNVQNDCLLQHVLPIVSDDAHEALSRLVDDAFQGPSSPKQEASNGVAPCNGDGANAVKVSRFKRGKIGQKPAPQLISSPTSESQRNTPDVSVPFRPCVGAEGAENPTAEIFEESTPEKDAPATYIDDNATEGGRASPVDSAIRLGKRAAEHINAPPAARTSMSRYELIPCNTEGCTKSAYRRKLFCPDCQAKARAVAPPESEASLPIPNTPDSTAKLVASEVDTDAITQNIDLPINQSSNVANAYGGPAHNPSSAGLTSTRVFPEDNLPPTKKSDTADTMLAEDQPDQQIPVAASPRSAQVDIVANGVAASSAGSEEDQSGRGDANDMVPGIARDQRKSEVLDRAANEDMRSTETRNGDVVEAVPSDVSALVVLFEPHMGVSEDAVSSISNAAETTVSEVALDVGGPGTLQTDSPAAQMTTVDSEKHVLTMRPAARDTPSSREVSEFPLSSTSPSRDSSTHGKRGRKNYTGGTGLGNWRERPLGTYERLIKMALCDAPGGRLQARGVCEWIARNIPGYDISQTNWQHGIGMTMSAHATLKGKALFNVEEHRDGIHNNELGKSSWYSLKKHLVAVNERWDPVLEEPVSPPKALDKTKTARKKEISQPRKGATVFKSPGRAADRSAAQSPEHSTDDEPPITSKRPRSLIATLRGGKGAARTISTMETLASAPVAAPTSTSGLSIGQPDTALDKNEADDYEQSATEVHSEDDEPLSRRLRRRPRAQSDDEEPLARRLRQRSEAHVTQSAATESTKVVVVPPLDVSEPTGVDANTTPIDRNKAVTEAVARATEPVASIGVTSATGLKRQAPKLSLASSRVLEMSLADLIKADSAKVEYTARSLFEEWPEYDNEARSAKLEEIAKRPTRKQIFGRPAVYSRLARVPVSEFKDTMVSQPREHAHLRSSPQKKWWLADSMVTEGVRECGSVEELFDLPSNPLLTLKDGQLCFRDQAMALGDKSSRTKGYYPTGYL